MTAEAETGEDAQPGRRHHPEVVLVDIDLPDVDGIEATRRRRAAAPGTTVVLMRTGAPDDVPADCGAVAFLRKEDLTPCAGGVVSGYQCSGTDYRARARSADPAACHPPIPCTPPPGGVDDEHR